MNSVVAEHLIVASDGLSLLLAREVEVVPSGTDPVAVAEQAVHGAFAHSTSWRWTDGTVVLTFVHALPDAAVRDWNRGGGRLSVADLGLDAVACHGIRHLHFLRHTDSDVAALEGFDAFWAFAGAVVADHHPAVAGLLPGWDAVGPDYVI